MDSNATEEIISTEEPITTDEDVEKEEEQVNPPEENNDNIKNLIKTEDLYGEPENQIKYSRKITVR